MGLNFYDYHDFQKNQGAISFHVMVVFGPGKNLLFKSILGRCAESSKVSSYSLLPDYLSFIQKYGIFFVRIIVT